MHESNTPRSSRFPQPHTAQERAPFAPVSAGAPGAPPSTVAHGTPASTASTASTASFGAAVALDALDRRLLTLLQEDAALSLVELARRVHTSAPTCQRRIRRLVETGVIERQVAIVSPRAVDAGLTAIVEVTLDRQATDLGDAFRDRAVAEPAVLQCYRTSPGPDFVLLLQVRDMAGYRAFAHRLLSSESNVRTVRTYFATERAKFDTRLPV